MCSSDLIDEVIVETVVKLPGARAFWKRHFIEETNELQQEVRFSKFANALAKALDTSTAAISKAKDLITDDGNVTMASFDRSSRWFGEFYNAAGGERLIDSMAIMAGEFNKAAGWFHGNITKDEADKRLLNQPEGTLLIRTSTTNPDEFPFAVSKARKSHEAPTHLRIKRLTYVLDGQPQYACNLPTDRKSVV